MINPDNFEDDDQNPAIWFWCAVTIGLSTLAWIGYTIYEILN